MFSSKNYILICDRVAFFFVCHWSWNLRTEFGFSLLETDRLFFSQEFEVLQVDISHGSPSYEWRLGVVVWRSEWMCRWTEELDGLISRSRKSITWRAGQVVKCYFFDNSDSENVPNRVPVLEKPLLNLGILPESEDSVNRQHLPLRLGNLLMPNLLNVKNIPWITTAFHGRGEPVPRRLIAVWRTFKFSVWKLIIGSRIRSSLSYHESLCWNEVWLGEMTDEIEWVWGLKALRWSCLRWSLITNLKLWRIARSQCSNTTILWPLENTESG